MPHSQLAGLEDKYEVLAKLREGGMGAVYKVRHRLLEEARVVKVIRPHLEADEELRRRFLREARSAVRLRHPNIAQVYDFTVDEDGTSLMVMEFIDGRDLAELLRLRGRLSVDLVLEVGMQCLKALSYLHRNDFVHRDISPDNIMLTQDVDAQPLVKLIDLGIAKPLGGSLDLTGTGLFLGKIRYASPEQFGAGGGRGPLDQRSDLYSLGVALYELATGSHPIVGDTSEALLAGHLFHPPRSFAESDPRGNVPEDLRQVILRALAKQPADRFPNAITFCDALGEIKQGWKEPELDATVLEMTLIAPRAEEPTLVADDRAAGDPEALLADLTRRVEELLAEGRLVDAEAALEAGAVGELADEPVEPLRRRLQELRATLEAALEEARACRQRGDFAAAGEALERVRAIEPGNPGAAALEAQMEAAVERDRRRAEEDRARVRDLLDAGNLAEARRALADATAAHGRTELFAQVERRIAEREAAEQAREKAAEELVARVDELLDAGRPASAESELGRVRGRHGDHPGFEELGRRIAARRALAREHLAAAAELLAAGDLAAATGAVEELRRLDRELPEALELQAKIELEKQRHRLGLGEAVARVEAEMRAGELAAAERLLAAAEATYGAAEPLVALRQRLERLGAEQRDRHLRHREAVERIGATLAEGELDAARVALEAALAEHGAGPELEALRTRLADEHERRRQAAARAEEDRRQGRRQQVAELLRQAREAADHEDFAAATAALDRAQRLEPGNPAIAALGEQVASSRQRAAMFPAEAPRETVPRRRRRGPLVAAAGLLGAIAVGAALLLPGQAPEREPEPEPVTVSREEALRQGLAGLDLGRYRALVIGNNDYLALPQLNTAVPDARSVGAALEQRFGFEVELLVDGTREEILRRLEEVAGTAREGDNLLLFYAGHGFVDQVNGRGYWQPVDAEPASTANWISSVEITDMLRDSPARRVLVIADSCFSGALLDRELAADPAASGPSGVRERAGRRARLALTSGALQPVLDAGGGGHSVFSGALLEVLGEESVLDARGLFQLISERVEPVVTGLGGEQTAQLGALETDEEGGFFLVPGGEL